MLASFFKFWMKQEVSRSQGRVFLEGKVSGRTMHLATVQPFSIWGLLFENALSLEGVEAGKSEKTAGVQPSRSVWQLSGAEGLRSVLLH